MKHKGDPGPHMEYDAVEQMLTKSVYGVADLVRMGLFHSGYFVRQAVENGKLKGEKVNKCSLAISKEDLLDYWNQHRKVPFEPLDHSLTVQIKKSELEYVLGLLALAQKTKPKFCFNDLFRNLINHMKHRETTPEEFPHLFVCL